MSSRLNLVIGFVALFSVSLLTQNAEAQRFRSGNRYCPQQVRYVPPTCSTVQYYVLDQRQLFARPFFPQTTMQGGYYFANQPATPVLNAPSTTNSAPMPIGAVNSSVFNENAIQPATQTLNPVAPGPIEQPILNSPATLEPVPAGNTEIAPPGTEAPPAAEPPKAKATPAGAKSILEKGN